VKLTPGCRVGGTTTTATTTTTTANSISQKQQQTKNVMSFIEIEGLGVSFSTRRYSIGMFPFFQERIKRF